MDSDNPACLCSDAVRARVTPARRLSVATAAIRHLKASEGARHSRPDRVAPSRARLDGLDRPHPAPESRIIRRMIGDRVRRRQISDGLLGDWGRHVLPINDPTVFQSSGRQPSAPFQPQRGAGFHPRAARLAPLWQRPALAPAAA